MKRIITLEGKRGVDSFTFQRLSGVNQDVHKALLRTDFVYDLWVYCTYASRMASKPKLAWMHNADNTFTWTVEKPQWGWLITKKNKTSCAQTVLHSGQSRHSHAGRMSRVFQAYQHQCSGFDMFQPYQHHSCTTLRDLRASCFRTSKKLLQEPTEGPVSVAAKAYRSYRVCSFKSVPKLMQATLQKCIVIFIATTHPPHSTPGQTPPVYPSLPCKVFLSEEVASCCVSTGLGNAQT